MYREQVGILLASLPYVQDGADNNMQVYVAGGHGDVLKRGDRQRQGHWDHTWIDLAISQHSR